MDMIAFFLVILFVGFVALVLALKAVLFVIASVTYTTRKAWEAGKPAEKPHIPDFPKEGFYR